VPVRLVRAKAQDANPIKAMAARSAATAGASMVTSPASSTAVTVEGRRPQYTMQTSITGGSTTLHPAARRRCGRAFRTVSMPSMLVRIPGAHHGRGSPDPA
jgi:hypothetical protein